MILPIVSSKVKDKKSSLLRKISKVGDLSRGWPEGSFSIATTPLIAPLYPSYVPYNIEC